MGCHFLLQGICPTQGSNLGLPHCRQMLYHLSHEGSPTFKQGLAKPKAQLSHTLIFIHSEGRTSEPVKLLSHVQLFATPRTVAYQAPPSMEFSRQEYWSGFPFPSPGDLPNPGIEPRSPELQADSLLSELHSRAGICKFEVNELIEKKSNFFSCL